MSVVGLEGIAYVEAVNTVLVRPSFSGWWERGEDLRPDGPDDFTVTYQQWDDLDEATEWASRRSAQVSLRVETFSYSFRVRRPYRSDYCSFVCATYACTRGRNNPAPAHDLSFTFPRVARPT